MVYVINIFRIKRKSRDQHAEMRTEYMKRTGFRRRTFEENISIHETVNSVNSLSIRVGAKMQALFKTKEGQWTKTFT